MTDIDLTGKWKLKESGEEHTIPAEVPGCVHLDLMAAGEIDDPFYRDNENDLLWIGETDWVYTRSFEVTEEVFHKKEQKLICEGLDTLTEIRINGHQVAKTDNMFRTWEFNIKDYLLEGTNEISIIFYSPMQYLRKKDREEYIPAWSVGDHRLHGGGWLRKQPSNFGWDWGPKLVTSGIWKDIRITARDRSQIKNFRVSQEHGAKKVDLWIYPELDLKEKKGLKLKTRLKFKGTVLLEYSSRVHEGQMEIHIPVDEPQLWWPNGMGDQPLYEVELILEDGAGECDHCAKKIGLRTVKLVREEDQLGETFKFAVNGEEFFARGANWIPADAFVAGLDYDRYRDLLESAVQANMNMLRVWGGGIYEDDDFYEICDELGILVWQDFIFACGTYPAFDEKFMENVKKEAVDNIKRIRDHASLALWCGNNEIEQGIAAENWDKEHVKMSWEDYNKLFDELLPELVKKYDPDTDYWPGSPHTPLGDRSDFRNEDSGDVHIWEVWHGKKPFVWYRECAPRFCSEFGFQSFPNPLTVCEYTEPEDRNITSYVMEHHQRSGIGNTTIMQYMLDWFRLPQGFENTLHVSQILQGLGIKYAVEHWRREEKCRGTLYWQLNDNWPAPSWSSLDYYGRWKNLHYRARDFYAPILVSGIADQEEGRVRLYVTSDLPEEKKARLSWNLLHLNGDQIRRDEIKGIEIIEGNLEAAELDLQKELKEFGSRNLLLYFKLQIEGSKVSDNMVFFAPPKHMPLKNPEIKYKVKQAEKTKEGLKFLLQLTSQRPALWCWIEGTGNLEAVPDDNYFHLWPKEPKLVEVNIPEAENSSIDRSQTISDIIELRSLVDTY